MSPEHLEVVVNSDGGVNVSPAELERLGIRPGDHLRLVKDDETPTRKRKSARGLGVGKVPPDEILTWEDFEAVHQANVEAAERKYGQRET